MLHAELFTSTWLPIRPRPGPSNSCANPPFRPHVPVYSSWPRRDLLHRIRCFDSAHGPWSHRTTRAEPEGEFALRKTNRDTPAWVSGLDNPVDRGASSKNSAVVARALQSRPTALFFGAGPPRSAPEFPRAFATPEASLRPNRPSYGTLRPERASPRVQPLGPRYMTVVEFLRMTVAVARQLLRLVRSVSGATPLARQAGLECEQYQKSPPVGQNQKTNCRACSCLSTSGRWPRRWIASHCQSEIPEYHGASTAGRSWMNALAGMRRVRTRSLT